MTVLKSVAYRPIVMLIAMVTGPVYPLESLPEEEE